MVHVPLRGPSVVGAGGALYVGPDASLPSVAAYRAVPASAPGDPALAKGGADLQLVFLVHGAWGLDEAICDLADAIAGDGSVVLVPDLARGRRPAAPEAAAAFLAGLDPEDAIRTLAAAIDALRADPLAPRGPAGIGTGVRVAGFDGGASLAAFLAVVRPEVERLVLAGGDPPRLPVAAWDGLEADVLVLLGADQDGGPAAAWAAIADGLGCRVAIETTPTDAVADDPGDPWVVERIRAFLGRQVGG